MNDIPVVVSKEKYEEVTLIIPECCREGWPDCPHVVNRTPEVKRKNIGL